MSQMHLCVNIKAVRTDDLVVDVNAKKKTKRNMATKVQIQVTMYKNIC